MRRLHGQRSRARLGAVRRGVIISAGVASLVFGALAPAQAATTSGNTMYSTSTTYNFAFHPVALPALETYSTEVIGFVSTGFATTTVFDQVFAAAPSSTEVNSGFVAAKGVLLSFPCSPGRSNLGATS